MVWGLGGHRGTLGKGVMSACQEADRILWSGLPSVCLATIIRIYSYHARHRQPAHDNSRPLPPSYFTYINNTQPKIHYVSYRTLLKPFHFQLVEREGKETKTNKRKANAYTFQFPFRLQPSGSGWLVLDTPQTRCGTLGTWDPSAWLGRGRWSASPAKTIIALTIYYRRPCHTHTRTARAHCPQRERSQQQLLVPLLS